MAKRTKTKIEDLTVDLTVEDITIDEVQDTFADKVRHLKSQGYDSNRIASLLGVHKQRVDTIE